MPEETLFTINELADYLKMQPITIYKHAAAGKLPGFKVGAAWRFKKSTIDKWIEAQENSLYGNKINIAQKAEVQKKVKTKHHDKNLPELIIGDLKLKVPIIQGAMGVKISTASLVSAVANYGAAGTIPSVALGYGRKDNVTNFSKASMDGLIEQICKTKELTKGIFGVNVMVALTNYEEHVNTVVKEGVDFIISGAGLPLKLPGLTEGAGIKLIPIVSSARAADIIIKTWKKRYNRLPDAIVVEGPLAGGHLGFKFDELTSNKYESLEKIVRDVVKLTKQYKEPPNNIPVIAAGGILTGKDIAKFLKLGASGVQIATPFVVTHECSVPDSYKQLYLSAKKEDIVIIESPVKMPGRAIRTKFIDRITNGKRIPYRCAYKCIKTCDPKTAQYCICEALYNAVKGDLDNAIVFCGTDVTKLHKIVSVKELLDNLIKEAERELYR